MLANAQLLDKSRSGDQKQHVWPSALVFQLSGVVLIYTLQSLTFHSCRGSRRHPHLSPFTPASSSRTHKRLNDSQVCFLHIFVLIKERFDLMWPLSCAGWRTKDKVAQRSTFRLSYACMEPRRLEPNSQSGLWSKTKHFIFIIPCNHSSNRSKTTASFWGSWAHVPQLFLNSLY